MTFPIITLISFATYKGYLKTFLYSEKELLVSGFFFN